MSGFLFGFGVGVIVMFAVAFAIGQARLRRIGMRRGIRVGPSGLRRWEVAVGATAFVLALLVTGALFFDPGVVVNSQHLTASERTDAETAAREAGLKLAAGILAVGAGVIALRRYGLSRLEHMLERDRLTSERYARAIELLGTEKEDTMTGALYGLEELGRETGRFQTAILETITAVLRRRSPASVSMLSPTRGERWSAGTPIDEVADSALDVLRRRSGWNSSFVNLQRADLSNSNLEGIDLRGAQLAGTDLRGARVDNALLQGCTLIDARVEGASFRGANLMGATLLAIDFSHTDLTDVVLDGIFWKHIRWPAGVVPPTPEIDALDKSPEQLRRASLHAAGLPIPDGP